MPNDYVNPNRKRKSTFVKVFNKFLNSLKTADFHDFAS